MVSSPQQTIKRELASIPSQSWQSSYVNDSNESETISWIPLFKIDSGKTLGLSENGYWVSNSGTSVVVYKPGKLVLSLFPCLEMEYDNFFDKAKAAFLKLELSQELINTFPTSELVFLALTDVSGYWAELALSWLEHITMNDQIKEQLLQITKDKDLSQKTRQKASKFLKGKIKQKV